MWTTAANQQIASVLSLYAKYWRITQILHHQTAVMATVCSLTMRMHRRRRSRQCTMTPVATLCLRKFCRRFIRCSQNILYSTQPPLGHAFLARKRTFHHVESESCDSWKRPRADTMHRWHSCTAIDDCQVTADGQRRCGLPLSKCRRKVRHTITHETLAELLVGNRHALRPVDKIIIVDCRYPYEYEYGHIRGAINAWNTVGSVAKNCIISILHCSGPDRATTLRAHTIQSSIATAARREHRCYILLRVLVATSARSVIG